jgi:hypothetical protein
MPAVMDPRNQLQFPPNSGYYINRPYRVPVLDFTVCTETIPY